MRKIAPSITASLYHIRACSGSLFDTFVRLQQQWQQGFATEEHGKTQKYLVSANKFWVGLSYRLATEVAASGPMADRPPTRAVPASA